MTTFFDLLATIASRVLDRVASSVGEHWAQLWAMTTAWAAEAAQIAADWVIRCVTGGWLG